MEETLYAARPAVAKQPLHTVFANDYAEKNFNFEQVGSQGIPTSQSKSNSGLALSVAANEDQGSATKKPMHDFDDPDADDSWLQELEVGQEQPASGVDAPSTHRPKRRPWD